MTDEKNNVATDADAGLTRYERYQKRLREKNVAPIENFLGKGKRYQDCIILPNFYWSLLAWSLQRIIEREEWETVRKLGYRAPEAIFVKVEVDYRKKELLLRDGQLLLQKGAVRLVVTAEIGPESSNSVSVEGLSKDRVKINALVKSINTVGREENIYRGKQVQLGTRIKFLDIRPQSWDAIILNDRIKETIQKNSVGFLRKTALWKKLGIPTKRGLIFAGPPGCGKTLACKAVMSDATSDISVITTVPFRMADDGYLSNVFSLAADLGKAIIIIDDIECVALSRDEFGNYGNPALLSLLVELDGLESKSDCVVIATTNNITSLDSAMSQRPSRFDVICHFENPNLEERRLLLNNLCNKKIKIEEASRNYIAERTEGFSPAKLQETIWGLAIEFGESLAKISPQKSDIDTILTRLNTHKNQRLGFSMPQERQPDLLTYVNKNKEK